MYSVLKPGKKISPHRGPYQGVLRYHLGLIIPKSEACHIKILGVTHCWQEGKSFIFDDTYEHEAQNLSQEERVILFVDFFRPLPRPLNWLNRFIFHLISHSPFITNVLKKIEETQGEKSGS